MPNCKTIAICNQKGGVGKTTSTVNLGVGLAMQGKESNPFNGILHHKEGVDLMPSSSDLFDFEIGLVTAMNREVTLIQLMMKLLK